MQPPPAYPPVPPPPAPAPPVKSWLQRNLPWLVPLGCLGLLVGLATLVTVVLGIVTVSIRSSDAYREAMAQASSHPAVQRELGSPIEPGLFISGSIQVTGPSGNADLAIPISGPRKDGTLYVVGTKSAGRWTFSTLEVEVDGSAARIPLMAPAP